MFDLNNIVLEKKYTVLIWRNTSSKNLLLHNSNFLLLLKATMVYFDN